jgi:hypothetical protein
MQFSGAKKMQLTDAKTRGILLTVIKIVLGD